MKERSMVGTRRERVIDGINDDISYQSGLGKGLFGWQGLYHLGFQEQSLSLGFIVVYQYINIPIYCILVCHNMLFFCVILLLLFQSTPQMNNTWFLAYSYFYFSKENEQYVQRMKTTNVCWPLLVQKQKVKSLYGRYFEFWCTQFKKLVQLWQTQQQICKNKGITAYIERIGQSAELFSLQNGVFCPFQAFSNQKSCWF
eukprot:TRINITY_DN30089_c0_g1_i1.p1 TRINITY_DN30089_c0_g1~~TRINITY_DN30089_c0_g1_i1.p1  ORF type:complete len:199 (-),score=-7.93 TRINITY_DN30089_c0_g1_i1:96-692(-)